MAHAGRIIAAAFFILSVDQAPLVMADEAVIHGQNATHVEFFEKRIRPALAEHCYSCHSRLAETLEGGLRLDSREGLRAGGDSGPAIVAGQPDDSLLLMAISYSGRMTEMPPKGKLPENVIEDFHKWIAMGAPDPRSDQSPSQNLSTWQETLAERRDWWSLRPVRQQRLPPPARHDQSASPIDRFVIEKLDQAGLMSQSRAEPRVLARRLNVVLTGLPPATSDMKRFLDEIEILGRDQAILRLVDRLLASPHFGERWARHWMDVVRFSETHGNEWNYEVHHAWRYRDYLIRAFNDDLSYDKFVREHIAGDLLERARRSTEGFNESVIATAFYRFGEANHDDCVNLRQIGFDIADNQIDTLTKAFQATTVACARCHDHKLDPVSMQDYYALLGILRSSRLVSHTIDSTLFNQRPIRELERIKSEIRSELAHLWQQDARELARYLLAADGQLQERQNARQLTEGLDSDRLEAWHSALKLDNPPNEHPLSVWLAVTKHHANLQERWLSLRSQYETEQTATRQFNAKHFTDFGDFRGNGPMNSWELVGLRQVRLGDTDFTLHGDGPRAVQSILSEGQYTHLVSRKLQGTIRSPILPGGKRFVSFQVAGENSSAVRLVTNNCQLNYANYRALTSRDFQWITFSIPDDPTNLRTYAELMTKLTNPKFPDQLGTLGGDKQNHREPWSEATADPQSWFGITRAVVHDCDQPPRPDLSHMLILLANDATSDTDSPPPESLTDVADRYAAVMRSAVERWADGRTTLDDAVWLDWMVKHNLLGNTIEQTPRLSWLVEHYRSIETSQLSVPRITPGIADFDDGINQRVLVRGDCMRPGDRVPRRYLEVLGPDDQQFATGGSGRLVLAEQIASPTNPLTARVMVNRVWHHLFGVGLVRTVDDFGRMGQSPSHPRLLDSLAAQFVADGWSLKRLVRRIVLSNTFQMSSHATSSGRQADPDNRLLHHYPPRRMEAEAIRDTILQVSDRLDRSMYGQSVDPFRDKAYPDRRLFPGPLDANGRRSLYIKVNLMEEPKFLGLFDIPGGKVTQGRRDVTNVPAQALAMLNDPFVVQQAERWATRLVGRPGDTVRSRIEYMFVSALNRYPTPKERQRFAQLIRMLSSIYEASAEQSLDEIAIWKDVAHAFFNLKELVYIR